MGAIYEYRNKEISWLSFNERVLQEASDSDVPLGDRIRFMGIYSGNLDEFYRTRVANLNHLTKIRGRPTDGIAGDPAKALDTIHTVVLEQSQRFEKLFGQIREELEHHGVLFLQHTNLNPEQKRFVDSYFHHQVRPRVFPMMLDRRYKMPFLKDRALYLAVRLNRRDKQSRYSIIEVPMKVLPRFVVLPGRRNRKNVMFIDDVIRCGIPSLFRMLRYDGFEAYTIKITRDAALDLEDDLSLSYLDKVNSSLKKRKRGEPIRLVYDKDIPEEMLEFFIRKLKLQDRDILVPGGKYHYFRDFISFDRVLDLPRDSGRDAIPHKRLQGQNRILKVLAKHDVLLHFPFNSFDHIIDLLREASIDPRVESIKITLYRVARNSSVVNALINASRNRKAVTVVLELQARFDEKSNIYWASKLKEEGVVVIFGAQNFKVHAKTCLITRREKEGGKRYYFVTGTGNYNEDTARLYTDFMLMSADQKLGKEIVALFSLFESGLSDVTKFKHTIISPLSTRKRLIKLIKAETANARKGLEAYVDIKVNNLSDREIIDALYTAASRGVRVRLVVRGMFSVITEQSKLKENIQAISIVDKYLEHSRMFVFANGGEELVFIGSADLLTRNIDRRFELICPIYSKSIRQYLRDIFNIYWQDGEKARVLDRNLTNQFRGNGSGIRSQDEVYEYTLAENK